MNQFMNNPLSTPSILSGGQPKVELSVQSFEKWRSFIYDSCGIYFQDNKKYLLESRLQKRVTFLGLKSFDEYLEYLKFNPGRNLEMRYLYEAITINETFFFRNQPQLDALVSTVVPQILDAKGKFGRPKIRIWSAASSTGEEAYSTAIVISELIKPKVPTLDVEIIGTDISQAVIETAKKGIYKEYSIRNTPPYYLKKYFKFNGSAYEINSSIRDMVSFKLLNLYDDQGMRAMTNFDIIYCANVLIYFNLNSKIKVVQHLYNSLQRGGYLFIGYSETLHGVSKAFKVVSFPKTIGYKKE
ncbi:MAG TPA: protein-glutamate O-methyltransferase CheR [Ignavibacteriaceae bacterium]|nr:protein-glutamate O-methyltransferase CheR [Ignavibacteriaceae bacterium]